MAKVETFNNDGETVQGEILSGPTSTGLFTVKMPEGNIIVRHRDRLQGIDEESRKLLRQSEIKNK